MSTAKTPLLNAVAQGDIDMQGYRLLNLDLSTLASGAPFSDATALIKGSVDTTKLARFEVDGNTTGTTRVYTLPNYNATFATLAGIEDLTNKSINGITFGGTGGFTLEDSIVSLVGNLQTDGAVRFAGEFITVLRVSANTDITLPITGTIATTAQLPVISDVAYNEATWNGNLDGASKNAIRDQIENGIKPLLPPFADSTSLLKGSSDATKLLKIEIDGFTTGTTRTFTAPNKSGTWALLDDIPFTAGILFGSDEDGRSLSLAGDVAFYGVFTLAGGFGTLFNVTGVTDITFPTTGTLATLDGAETLTNKVINGGEANSLEVLSILPEGLIYPLRLQVGTSGFSSARILTINIPNADTSLTLGGNLSTANAFSTLGAFPIALTASASTALTLPIAGTLASFVSSKMAIAGTTAVLTAGSGSPEGVVDAPRGSIYLRTNGGAGTCLYVKETTAIDATGWAAK